ncbi:hypothetical protein B0H13DRAFT_1920892 [Mycena leptocephala]|nr:hypothetical protein B0H13DRAFT_1920892 [Mycena leptocephala]
MSTSRSVEVSTSSHIACTYVPPVAVQPNEKSSKLGPTNTRPSCVLWNIGNVCNVATDIHSAAAPFLESLPTATVPTSSTTAGDDMDIDTTPKTVNPVELVAQPIVHDQKGLSKAQAAGLQSVRGTLLSNNGGISSGHQPFTESPTPFFGNDNGPPIGPPSTVRPLTRSRTLPHGAMSASVPVGSPVTATPGNPAASADPPMDHVSAFKHFGMIIAHGSETAVPMGKCATRNIEILADVLCVIEARGKALALDLDKLVVEVRLGAASSLAHRAPHSPSPEASPTPRSVGSRAPSEPSARAPSEPSLDDDVEELFSRVRDLERFETAASSEAEGLSERVAALEAHTPPSALSITKLSTALVERFKDITSDRNKLNDEIQSQAERQAKVTAKLQLEHNELKKSLSELQATIARLELGTPVQPLRLAARSSDRRDTERSRITSKNLPLRIPRSRSPPVETPTEKRAKSQGFPTMGPFGDSLLPPRELFKSHIPYLHSHSLRCHSAHLPKLRS